MSTPPPFQGRRVPKGVSDLTSLPCTCKISPSHPVLLFYRYFDSTPHLPFLVPSDHPPSLTPSSPSSSPFSTPAQISTRSTTATFSHAQFQQDICTRLSITGKIRVGREGINATVCGSAANIDTYIRKVCGHWSLRDLDLIGGGQEEEGGGSEREGDRKKRRKAFFKPGMGCPHVFEGRLSVKVVDEITPLGVRDGWVPGEFLDASVSASASSVTSVESENGKNKVPPKEEVTSRIEKPTQRSRRKLIYKPPTEFHKAVLENRSVLLDARNLYEARAGYFANAILPPIRKFGGLPGYMAAAWPEIQSMMATEGKKKEILTYCTGGIRCEKGARIVMDRCIGDGNDEEVEGEDVVVATLEGGIVAYLDWVQEEIEGGRMKKEDSLFRGRNYLFDARGSLGLAEEDVCATPCKGCGGSTTKLGKCSGKGCCIVLVLCEACEGQTFCCEGCVEISGKVTEAKRRKGVCACEREREVNEKNGVIFQAP